MTKAQIIEALDANKADLAQNAERIAGYGNRNAVALVRLHDKRHDIEARNMMLCRMFDAAFA